MRNIRRRWLAVGGVAGPVAFIAAWAVLGAQREGYTSVHQAISELARTSTETQWPMTAGMCAFGAGMLMYAVPARSTLAAGAGLSTIGVALTPLGSPQEPAHFVAAAATYAFLAALPLRRAAQTTHLRALHIAVGTVTAVVLIASFAAPTHHGLLQRAGLTLADAWIVCDAVRLLNAKKPAP